MYSTSQAYKNMMLTKRMKSRFKASLTSGSSTTLLEGADIVDGSVSWSRRSTNNKTFGFGSCYVSTLSFTSFKAVPTMIQGNYISLTASLDFSLYSGNSTEEIPMGVFVCDSPATSQVTTQYTCHDKMIFLDKNVETRVDGDPFSMAAYICDKCGIEIGNTANEIAAKPNGTQRVVIDPLYIKTYRDAVALIACILGAYCQMGRDGKFYFKWHHNTADMTLQRQRVQSLTLAGYKTVFAGVRCRFLAEQNFYPYEYVVDGREGIIVDLGDISIIEDDETTKNRILENLYTGILADLEYYPAEVDFAGDPSIDEGDMITVYDMQGYTKNILVSSFTYTQHGTCTLQSEGANPKQDAVATQADRLAQRQETQNKESTVVTATYANANMIEIGSSSLSEITSLRFITNKALTAVFGAEIPVYSNGEGYIEISYHDGGIVGDTVKARVHEGYNLITLVNHLYYEASRIVLLQLKAQSEALTSGGTAPTISVSPDTIRSYIFAQGIETEVPWDGVISITEEIAYVDSILAVYGLTDGVTVDVEYPMENTLSQVVNAVAVGLNTISVSDTVSVSTAYSEWVMRMGRGNRSGMGRLYERP